MVHEDDYHVSNLIVLVAKQYMYRCRCLKLKLCIEEFKSEIGVIQLMEKEEVLRKNKVFLYNKRWYDTIDNPMLQDYCS